MRNFIRISIAVTTLIMVLGYLTASPTRLGLAALVAGLGLVWALASEENWDWISSLGLVAFMIMAGLGLQLGASILWMLLAAVGALTTWDMTHFGHRLLATENIADRGALTRAHFKRLQVVVGSGLALAALSLVTQIRLTFGWAILLAFLLVISVSWVVGHVKRRRSETGPPSQISS